MNSPLHKLKSSSKTRTTALHKAFLAAGLLSGAGLSSIVFAAPASAANCFDGTFATLGDATLWAGGVAGVCTDKTYTFGTSFYTNFLATDKVNISTVFDDHLVTITSDSGGWVGGTYTFDYSVASTGQWFSKYGSGITAPPDKVGNYKVSGAATLPTFAIATLPAANSLMVPYLPGVISDTFTTTLTVGPGAGNYVTQINSVLTQYSPGTDVPGPLPLLGAGAAFGFSRRIRSRIKASV